MGKRRASSRRWFAKQSRDPYVRQRASQGYRSRSAYKLKEILARDRLVEAGDTVLDLGASPGGWSQTVQQIVGTRGLVIAVDRIPMAALAGVRIIQGDCCEKATIEKIQACLDERRPRLVLSDAAPNITGIRARDEANFLSLFESVYATARRFLVRDGAFIAKVFQYPGTDARVGDLKHSFAQVARRKPESSRAESREFYVVAKGFRIQR